jgi:hypothetical protein
MRSVLTTLEFEELSREICSLFSGGDIPSQPCAGKPGPLRLVALGDRPRPPVSQKVDSRHTLFSNEVSGCLGTGAQT